MMNIRGKENYHSTYNVCVGIGVYGALQQQVLYIEF